MGRQQRVVCAIPRPRGRGLIEARSVRPLYRSLWAIPRPRGRGLIEAPQSSHFRRGRFAQFRDRAVAASLKPFAWGGLDNEILSIPRPRGRGLIEATLNPRSAGSPILIPRPRGRGLIEAGLAISGPWPQ